MKPMKLFTSDTSPYGRKVRIVLAEKGLTERVEIVSQSPLAGEQAALRAVNPLGKIPALVSEQGRTLYDSRVICEYLDGLAPSPILIPEGGPSRIDALRRQALGDGLMDAAFNLVMERRRPEAQRSEEWATRWTDAIHRAAAAMAADVSDTFDLGAISFAAALGYADFRLGDLAWGKRAPKAAAWWSVISERASVKTTAPT